MLFHIRKIPLISFLILLLCGLSDGQCKEKVIFQHALQGFIATKLQEITTTYNNSQDDFEVVLTYGGNYFDSFDNFLKNRFEGEKRPHLMMVSEFNTPTMESRTDSYVPVGQVLQQSKDDMNEVIRAFYSFEGDLVSFPFNCSVPVLYYNKDLFKKAGLPDRAPQTWQEVESFSQELVKAGYVGFTTAWPAAYVFEHYAVVHNIDFARGHNGFEAPFHEANFLLDESVFVSRLKKFADWQKKGLYSYQGQETLQPEKFFTDGKCGMLLQGANRYSLLKGNKPAFEIGSGAYPYDADLIKEPFAMNVCGTSLWILQGHDSYEGVKSYLEYLASSDVQAQWHQLTGYLPVTEKAYKKTLASGFYEKNSPARLAVEQIQRTRKALPNGVRLKDYGSKRQDLMDVIERVVTGRETSRGALRQFVSRHRVHTKTPVSKL